MGEGGSRQWNTRLICYLSWKVEDTSNNGLKNSRFKPMHIYFPICLKWFSLTLFVCEKKSTLLDRMRWKI